MIESGFYVPSVDSMTFQAEKALAVTVSIVTALFVLLIIINYSCTNSIYRITLKHL